MTATMKNLLFVLAALALGCASTVANAQYPQTAVVSGGEATAAEAAVVQRDLSNSFGKEWTDYVKSSGRAPTFSVGHADLNGDGRPDLLILLDDPGFGYCGSGGCSGYVILATAQGFGPKAIGLANFVEKAVVLPTIHKGMHDLRYDDARKVFVWDGAQYR